MNQSPAGRDRPQVVVGVDGSIGGSRALLHALGAAARRGAAVEVVTTYPVPLPWAGGSGALVPDPTRLAEETATATRALVDEARRGSGLDVPVEVFVSEGPAGPVLIERSRDAEVLVVGSRGRSVVRSALLGSVALHCVTGAACPVVVVPPEPAIPDAAPRVVVGLDNSDASRMALAAGLAEAGGSGATVEAVAVVEREDEWAASATSVAVSRDDVLAVVERGARQVVAEVVAAAGPDRPQVEVTVAEGSPADVLARRAASAQLLVLGSRGHGGIRGLLLGSVTLRCLVAAPCPVLVVRSDTDRVAESRGRAAG